MTGPSVLTKNNGTCVTRGGKRPAGTRGTHRRRRSEPASPALHGRTLPGAPGRGRGPTPGRLGTRENISSSFVCEQTYPRASELGSSPKHKPSRHFSEMQECASGAGNTQWNGSICVSFEVCLNPITKRAISLELPHAGDRRAEELRPGHLPPWTMACCPPIMHRSRQGTRAEAWNQTGPVLSRYYGGHALPGRRSDRPQGSKTPSGAETKSSAWLGDAQPRREPRTVSVRLGRVDHAVEQAAVPVLPQVAHLQESAAERHSGSSRQLRLPRKRQPNEGPPARPNGEDARRPRRSWPPRGKAPEAHLLPPGRPVRLDPCAG